MSDELMFLLPNGSMRDPIRRAVQSVGYELQEPDRTGFCGISNSIAFWQRDRRIIPWLVAHSRFHAGIAGTDFILNAGVGSQVRSITKLCLSRASPRPTKWVLAMKDSCDFTRRVRIGCELPGLASALIPRSPVAILDWESVTLEGSEETAIDDGLCDLVLCVTETGRSLKAAGLCILPPEDGLLQSMPEVIAKPALSDSQERDLQAIAFALAAVVEGIHRVMMTFDLPADRVGTLALPSEVAPTVSPLSREGWVAVTVCISRAQIGLAGSAASRAGGKGIVVQDVIAFHA